MIAGNGNSGGTVIVDKPQERQWSPEAQRIREDERTRIAREIHDELGQWLTALKLEAFLIQKAITAGDAITQQQLVSMVALVIETEKAVERIATELRHCILNDLELVAALESQGNELEKHTGIRHQFSSRGDLKLDANLSNCIFRVYQEALTNVARHAKATKVNTTIERTEDIVLLTIKDNGQGFDLTEAKTKNSFGLVGMEERASLFGGALRIESSKSNGTSVELRIPLTQKNRKKVR